MPNLVVKRGWSRRLRLLLLSFLILLSFWLRLVNLDAYSMWTDEGLTTLRSGYPIDELLSNRIEIQDAVTKDTHPPFYYLIVHFSRELLGVTDFVYRYPSLLAGVLLLPLLFQFGRQVRGHGTGLVAATLAAVNPLQIWYANEARMYTLLVLLAALSSYALWRAMSGHNLRRQLFFYVILATLAFYTHYTAAILIGGQSLFWFFLLWRRGQRRLLFGVAAIGLLVAIPLIPYTIPRLFTGAEAAYSYVPPVVVLKDVIFAFSLGVSVESAPITVSLAIGALGLLLAGAFASRKDGRLLVFLLIYIFAVPLGLIAGSIIKPMYLGVRHIMIGSPAFLLTASIGFDWLGSQAIDARTRLRATAPWTVLSVGAIVIMLSSFIPLRNLYQERSHEKSDFRSLIHYVESRAGNDDVIVYNDGVLLAVQEHYQTRSDVAVTALPIYPYQGKTALPHLAKLVNDYARVWLVTSPPLDGRDSERVVQGWLDTNLIVIDERSFPGRETEVKVIAYSTAAETVRTLPDGADPVSIGWDGLPALEGLQFNFDQPASLPTLWIDLFWRGGIEPAEDALIQFSLRGATGQEWISHNQILSQALSELWQGDGLVRQSYHVPVPVGTPPGEYTLFAHPFSREQEAAVGLAEPLAKIVLAESNSWPVKPVVPASDLPPIQFDNGLTLLAVAMADDHVRPGHGLPISLYWQAARDLSLPDIEYQIDLIGPENRIVHSQRASTGAEWLTEWPKGIIIRQDVGLVFSADLEAGRYRLGWRLFEAAEAVRGHPAWRPWSTESPVQGRVQVVAWSLVSELPDAGTILEAEIGSSIQLFGYDLDEPQPGSVDLTLYWVAKAVPDENYHTFVHLVASDGEIVSQLDRVPVNWLRPTRGWRPNEVLTDHYVLPLPDTLLPGDYQLITGMFDPESGVRPYLVFGGVSQTDNQLVLTTLTLP